MKTKLLNKKAFVDIIISDLINAMRLKVPIRNVTLCRTIKK